MTYYCLYLSETRRMPLVKQELFTFPEHINSPLFYRSWRWSIFSFLCSILWIFVCPLWIVIVLSVHLCLFFVHFHCVVCSSSTYGFWLLFWYLKTFLIELHIYFYFDEEFKSAQSMDVDNKERNIIQTGMYILYE
jgi:hypothetical protein